MPNEPEREIEKTLKTYAKQRRDEAGAPRPIHPATRKMLRDEALRAHFPARRGTGFWEGVWQLRRRMALGVGVIVLIGLACWIMLPGSPDERSKSMLAMNRLALREPSPAVKAEPMAGPKRAEDLRENELQKDRKQLDVADKNAEQPGSVPVGAIGGAAPLSTPTELADARNYKAPTPTDTAGEIPPSAAPPPVVVNAPLNQNATAAPPLSPAPPPPSATAATFDDGIATTRAGGGGAGGRLENKTSPVFTNQKFARLVASDESEVAAKKLNGLPVLASFRVEQTGGVIHVLDADGSVYTGSIVQAADAEKLDRLASERRSRDFQSVQKETSTFGSDVSAAMPASSTVSGLGIPLTTNILFRVSGTNLSLKQLVVFTGNWSLNQPAPPPPAAPPHGVEANGRLKFSAGTASPMPPVERVTGHAVIGTNQLDITAAAKP